MMPPQATPPAKYGPSRITRLITYGSLFVASILTALLLAYDIVNGDAPRLRFWLACSVIFYLLAIIHCIKKSRLKLANWMLIIIYEALAASVLINWGLSSSVGILTAGFAILLPGVLMTPRSILPVAFITLCIVICAHLLHVFTIVTPVIYMPTNPSSPLDVIAYVTILSVFALVSWISERQAASSLQVALNAEENIRHQKRLLAQELEKESSRLRQAQLEQMQQLYKFAAIGQSATATLHELSNHLSVLNLDIHDIKQQHKHSKAIASAQHGIEYINRMVRKVRVQLDTSLSESQTFHVTPVLNRSLADIKHKYKNRSIKLTKSLAKDTSLFKATGDPMNLAQCISILLSNAHDACQNTQSACVHMSVEGDVDTLRIIISDNGPGVSETIRDKLFQPLESTKPSGMGVGLYIAKHLIETQFLGKLELLESTNGAKFQITLKR